MKNLTENSPVALSIARFIAIMAIVAGGSYVVGSGVNGFKQELESNTEAIVRVEAAIAKVLDAHKDSLLQQDVLLANCDTRLVRVETFLEATN